MQFLISILSSWSGYIVTGYFSHQVKLNILLNAYAEDFQPDF